MLDSGCCQRGTEDMTLPYPDLSRDPGAHNDGGSEESLLKGSQVAAMANAHPNTVRYWANSGLLPSYRIGRRGDRRFRAQDVEELLASHNQTRKSLG